MIVILLIILFGILYRMGGAEGYDTKYRDIGCSLCILLIAFLLGIRSAWWTWPIAFGLHWGALSTYHKWLNKFFGHDKEDVHWYGWFFHGLVLGLAIMPIAHFVWGIVLLRSLIMGLFTMAWSEYNKQVVWEEVGRGVIAAATLLILIS